MNNAKRAGRFTSSQISRLTTSGKAKGSIGAPFYTYVEEKKIERRMGRTIDTDAYSQAMAWGKFMEIVVFNKLGTDYIITSLDTDIHPTINEWAGSKDFHKVKPGTREMYSIGDIKCFQPKKFAQYTDCLLLQDVDALKSGFKEEYWQLVSNAIINGVRYAEAVSFMPYSSDMKFIKEAVSNYDAPDQWKYRFIAEKDNDDLPVLPDGGYYKDVTKFEFKIPADDIAFLTKRVLEAAKLLKT